MPRPAHGPLAISQGAVPLCDTWCWGKRKGRFQAPREGGRWAKGGLAAPFCPFPRWPGQ